MWCVVCFLRGLLCVLCGVLNGILCGVLCVVCVVYCGWFVWRVTWCVVFCGLCVLCRLVCCVVCYMTFCVAWGILSRGMERGACNVRVSSIGEAVEERQKGGDGTDRQQCGWR